MHLKHLSSFVLGADGAWFPCSRTMRGSTFEPPAGPPISPPVPGASGRLGGEKGPLERVCTQRERPPPPPVNRLERQLLSPGLGRAGTQDGRPAAPPQATPSRALRGACPGAPSQTPRWRVCPSSDSGLCECGLPAHPRRGLWESRVLSRPVGPSALTPARGSPPGAGLLSGRWPGAAACVGPWSKGARLAAGRARGCRTGRKERA